MAVIINSRTSRLEQRNPVSQKIQVQYEGLDDLARKVGEAHNRADDLLSKARLCMIMMDNGAWIGRGADKYRIEMESYTIPALRKLVAALSDLRYGFLRASDTYRDAEQEAVRVIERFPQIRDLIQLGGGNFVTTRPSAGGGSGGQSGFGGGRPNTGGSGVPEDFFAPSSGGRTQPEGVGGGRGRPSFDFGFGTPDPRIPDIFPAPNGGTTPRPDWFTQFNEDIDGFNGAINGAVLLLDGGGSHSDHLNNIVGESVAGGGVPVSGLFVSPNGLTEEGARRAAGAVGGFLANNPNAQLKLSPGLQALINGVATDSLGRSLNNMTTDAQREAMQIFLGIIKTTVEALGRVLPFD
jgi:WXG100 family type VII secretion target